MKARSQAAGFTLIEMMVAIAVLSIGLVAVMSAQQASMNASMMIKRGQTAALLVRGIIFDIDQELKEEALSATGMAENSITDQKCEVPDEYEKIFTCRYDLERMDLEADQIQSLVDQSFGGLLGDGGLSALQGGGERGNVSSTLGGLIDGSSTSQGGLNLSGLGFLLPFLGPEGEALMSLCNINISALMMGFMGIQTFVPQVIQEVGNRTRKLTVKLAWNEGPFGRRDFSVVTYLTVLPEAQLQKLKEGEDTMDVLEQGGVIPPRGGGTETAPVVPTPPGGGGGR